MCLIFGKLVSCHYLAQSLFTLTCVCVFLTICCIFFSWTRPRKINYQEIESQPYIIERGPGYVKYIDKRNYDSIT